MSTAPHKTDDPATLISTQLTDGVLVAAIDMPGRRMNVFSWALMDAFDALIDRIATDDAVGSAVITSGKSSFLAGADLDMVRGFTRAATTLSRDELRAMTGRLGRLFVRLEALAKPTVAAINGLAFGGGLELTMACTCRIAVDSPGALLGTPEVLLGLLPGAGGTQRLPRLIGTDKGLEYLLSGRSIAPQEALAWGLVDELSPPPELLARASVRASELAMSRRRRDLKKKLDPKPFDFAAAGIMQAIADHYGYPTAVTARYPAYLAIIRAVIGGAALPIGKGSDHEIECFMDLIGDPTAGRMITTLFIDRQRADKLTAPFARAGTPSVVMLANGPAAQQLTVAFGKAGIGLLPPRAAATADMVIVSPHQQRGDGNKFVLLQSPQERVSAASGIYVRGSPTLGTAMEIVLPDGDEEARARALTLAAKLPATPFIRRGATSFLANLVEADNKARAAGLDDDGAVMAMSEAAVRFALREDIGDKALADVAAVVSGIFPAYAGGPFATANRAGSKKA